MIIIGKDNICYYKMHGILLYALERKNGENDYEKSVKNNQKLYYNNTLFFV